MPVSYSNPTLNNFKKPSQCHVIPCPHRGLFLRVVLARPRRAPSSRIGPSRTWCGNRTERASRLKSGASSNTNLSGIFRVFYFRGRSPAGRYCGEYLHPPTLDKLRWRCYRPAPSDISRRFEYSGLDENESQPHTEHRRHHGASVKL
jgi:hypothetical protein